MEKQERQTKDNFGKRTRGRSHHQLPRAVKQRTPRVLTFRFSHTPLKKNEKNTKEGEEERARDS